MHGCWPEGTPSAGPSSRCRRDGMSSLRHLRRRDEGSAHMRARRPLLPSRFRVRQTPRRSRRAEGENCEEASQCPRSGVRGMSEFGGRGVATSMIRLRILGQSRVSGAMLMEARRCGIDEPEPVGSTAALSDSPSERAAAHHSLRKGAVWALGRWRGPTRVPVTASKKARVGLQPDRRMVERAAAEHQRGAPEGICGNGRPLRRRRHPRGRDPESMRVLDRGDGE